MPTDKRQRRFDEELGRSWDALLDGDPTRLDSLDPDLAATIHQFQALDDAPAPPSGLREQIWQELTADPAGATVTPVTLAAAPTQNGAHRTRAFPAAPARLTVERRGWWTRGQVAVAAWSAIRAMVVAGLAGMIVGAVAGGLGGRIVMRIAAMMADPAVQGTITSEGQRVGEISTGGTIELMLFSGALFGIVGGVLYLALRPCLPWSGFRRGLVFGLLLLGVSGSFVLDPGNPDYQRIGSPELNVCLFSFLYLLFGLLVAPLADRFDRSLLRQPPRRAPRPMRWLAWLGIAFFAVLILFGTVGAAILVAPLGVLLVGAALVRLAISHWVGRFTRPADLLAHPRAAFATYGLLAIPCLAGLVVTVRSISEILGGGA